MQLTTAIRDLRSDVLTAATAATVNTIASRGWLSSDLLNDKGIPTAAGQKVIAGKLSAALTQKGLATTTAVP